MFNNYIVLGVYSLFKMEDINNKAADVQGLAANNVRTESSIKKLSYDGDNWAGIYDPKTKVMIGGVWFGRESFDNDFKITEVEVGNAQDALKYCAGLYLDYASNGIAMSFKELKNTYEEVCCREAELHSGEEWFWEE